MGIAHLCHIISTCILIHQGSSVLPLFLMLSGFTMAVVYGGRGPVDEETTLCCLRTGVNLFGDSGVQEGELHPVGTGSRLELWSWWQNRLARILPVYYLTSLPGIPLSALGFGQMGFTPGAIVTTLLGNTFLATTVSFFYLGFPLNGPAWTLSTLAVFWAFFPAMVSRAQRMPSPALLSSIVWWFWIQALLAFCVFFAAVVGGVVLPFQVATMHPIVRLPLFWMGVAAGALRTRATPEGGLPWFRSAHTHCSWCTLLWPEATNPITVTGPAAWEAVLNSHSAIFAGMLVSCALLEVAGVQLLGALWGQLLLALTALVILMALTLDGGRSVWSKILRHPISQWLGWLSFSLYLVHFPVIDAAALWLRGPVQRPSGWGEATCATEVGEASGSAWQACEDERAAYFQDVRSLPLWILPAVTVVSFLAAVGMAQFVEGPCRDACRAPRAPSASAPPTPGEPTKSAPTPRRRSMGGHKGQPKGKTE